jgi:hypothetical protein
MDRIRKKQDRPGHITCRSYLKQIKRTFPKDLKAPNCDMLASVYKQCEEFAEWAIGATPGAISHRHRDAAGSFSYLIVHSGKKLWVMREGHHQAPYQNDVVELSAGDVL